MKYNGPESDKSPVCFFDLYGPFFAAATAFTF